MGAAVKKGPVMVEEELARRIRSRSARIAVLGLGFVGLATAVELARARFAVTGFDPDAARVQAVNEGRGLAPDIADVDVGGLVSAGFLQATRDFAALETADVVLICVPTPATAEGYPDLHYVKAAAGAIAAHLHPGVLVVLQSTCPPGATRNLLLPVLTEGTGLRAGEDLFVAFSPERIDPGNKQFTIRNIPKVVGGVSPQCKALTCLLFESICEKVVSVSSPEAAEMTKLVENTFRFINISFINEMAVLCDQLGASIWEVIAAAGTKPFAFMAHYPGPGVGGRCIPIAPLFLESAERQSGVSPHVIEAARLVDEAMPGFVVAKLQRLLSERGRALAGARVLVLGVAYKADVPDARDSASFRVLELLRAHGARAEYFDPFVPEAFCDGAALYSLSEEAALSGGFDAALLLTPHHGIDYPRIARQVPLLLDTRNHLAGLAIESVVAL